MKKKLLAAGLITATLGMSIGFGAFAASKLTLVVNGTVAKVDPVVINGTTYVPVRAAAELLGATVGYDQQTGTVTVTSEGSTPTSVFKAGDFVFTQFQAENGTFGWSATVDVTNNGDKAYGGVVFTAAFYDANNNRVGTATGSASDLEKGATKTAKMITSDDLTGWTTVKFQIDADY
ncbi:stalk domain-containing protein [Paenibacillus thailandensis]|uniref:Stalk domain-containing protein n=1 Tax=Paenibacillus thailandensis TaxID=393250 RepID=A0ABW5R3A1_9BACL